MAIAVLIETGQKKVFAGALDWHGWSRCGKNEELALQALADYGDRYREVLIACGLKVPSTKPIFEVVERVSGNATTDFGAPGIATDIEGKAMSAAVASALAKQVEACWDYLDKVVADAPSSLRKGPRGGGRDRDKMFAHVLEAENAYARKLGIKHQSIAIDDKNAIAKMRDELITVISKPTNRVTTDRGWFPRYAARRIAWHVLDHAWEMEDRSKVR